MSETEGRPFHELDATELGVDGSRYRVAPGGEGMIVYEPMEDESTGGMVMTRFTHTTTTTFEGEGPLSEVQRYLSPTRGDQPVQSPYQGYSQLPSPSYPDYSQPAQPSVAVQEPMTKPYEIVQATEPMRIVEPAYRSGQRRNDLWYAIQQQTAERKRFRKIAIPSMIGVAVLTAVAFIAPTESAKSNGYIAGTECTSGGWASIFNLGSCFDAGLIHNYLHYLPGTTKTTGEKK